MEAPAPRQSGRPFEIERAHLAAIVASSTDAIVSTSPDGIILSWNAGAEKMFGYTAREAVGQSIAFVIPPGRIAEIEFAGELVQNYETVRVAKDGRRIDVALTVSPIRDASGAVIGTSRIARDIGERKRAEAALRQALELKDRILQASADCTELLGLDGRLLFMSEGGRKQLGIPGFSAVENSQWLDFWRGAGREAAQAAMAAAASGEVGHFEACRPTSGGTSKWWDVLVTPVIGAGNEPVQLLAIARDVTERRQFDERLREQAEEARTIMEVAPVAIWVSRDPHCREIFGNATANRFYEAETGENVSPGPPPGEPLRPRRYFRNGRELLPEELPMQEAATRGVDIRNSELEVLLPSGRRIVILGSASPLRDAAGNVRGCVGAFLDITDRQVAEYERKHAEEQLRELTERLSYHVDNSPLAVIEWGADMRLTRWSGEAERLFGWKAEEVLGKRMEDFHWIYDRDFEAVENVSNDLKTGKDVRRFSLNRNYCKDGSVVHCEWYNSSLVDESGRLRSILSLVLDVTARKRAEEALRESEDKFRTLADSIPQLAWMTDETGWIFWYNRRWYEYTGTKPAEMEGWGWQKVHHPEHVERVTARFRKAVEEGSVWEDTFPLRGNDGSYRWFLSRAVPIRDDAGRIVRWFGTNTDITERLETEDRLRQSEARFRRLYDANIVGILSADAEHVFEANDLFLSMIGYTREDLENGRVRWRDMTPPEYLRLDERGIEELLATGSCRPYEKEYFRKDGSRVPILIGATLLERSPLKWLCFVVDLAERKELERRLFEKQKLESIGLLAGGIAHDFNNLLVGILGNASLVQDMVPEDDTAHLLLGHIVAASERAAHLTRQMLAYSGKGRFVTEAIDMSDLVREMSRLLQPSIPSKVALRFDLARGLPPVEADAGQMQQVVMNLVINAAEAIASGAGTITVRTGARSLDPPYIRQALAGADIEPGAYVWLEVRDSGCGIDEQTMRRIFDPFFTTKFTGRGLGLAAVAGIVRGHKGAITVASAPGEGSTFTVFFPAAPGEAAEPDTASAPGWDLRAAGTVLVVDDEELVLETARCALEHHGCTVLRARGGAEAVDILKRDPNAVAAVLLDLSMPGMSGDETLALLRAVRPDLKVIASSGYSEAETMRLFSGQPVSGFIQKPYTAARLAEALRSVLEPPGAPID